MKDHPPIVVSTVAIVVLFGLLCKLLRQGASNKEIRQIHNLVVKNLAETEAMHRNLRRTRGAVNQIHQYIEPPVTKGVKKAASQIPSNQWPDRTDPAVSKGIAWETAHSNEPSAKPSPNFFC